VVKGFLEKHTGRIPFHLFIIASHVVSPMLEMEVAWLPQNVGVVSQKTVIFNNGYKPFHKNFYKELRVFLSINYGV
jgi:hypothetical protein